MNLKHQTLSASWQGISLTVTWGPDFIDRDDLKVAFVAVTSAGRVPLPISETGFNSRYLHPDLIEEWGGPDSFVVAWLDDAAKSKKWKSGAEERRQLSLF